MGNANAGSQDTDYYSNTRERYNDMLEKNPWMNPAVIAKQVDRISRENSSFKSKRQKIIRIVHEVARAVAPRAACKEECDQCCHMSTLIYEHEAELMAAASGRKMTRLNYRDRSDVLKAGKQFYGKACSFLHKRKCSIYEDRPLVCRVHHSLNDDASQCNTSVALENKTGVVMYSADIFEVPYHLLVLGRNPREPWGNILEFFPAESSRP